MKTIAFELRDEAMKEAFKIAEEVKGVVRGNVTGLPVSEIELNHIPEKYRNEFSTLPAFQVLDNLGYLVALVGYVTTFAGGNSDNVCRSIDYEKLSPNLRISENLKTIRETREAFGATCPEFVHKITSQALATISLIRYNLERDSRFLGNAFMWDVVADFWNKK